MYNIRLRLEPNPDGLYTVTSPDVPGLVTEGSTPTEILTNVQEALSALLSAWKQLGMDVPPALHAVSKDQAQTLKVMVCADAVP